jgi:ribonuclease BN (tRNA processing enzyme)
VEVSAAGRIFVFDAGTGIIGLGDQLIQRNDPQSVHIFLSHTHHDHIEGLRFFKPAYHPGWRCYVYWAGSGPKTLRRVLATVMSPWLFPVSMSDLPRPLGIRSLGISEDIRFRGARTAVLAARHSRAHPKTGVTLYRLTCAGRSVVYATDVEAPEGGETDVVALARGADVLIHDAQYTDAEYHAGRLNRAGWGHSTVRMAAEAARAARVGELILYHHDPNHDDAEVRRLERWARRIFPRSRAAVEGLEIALAAR